MTTQAIFKNFGPNWKWASMTSSGSARVHAVEPKLNDGTICYSLKRNSYSRCEAFDENELPPEGIVPVIWERTDFSNGPSFETDCFGCALLPQIPIPDEPELPPCHPVKRPGSPDDPFVDDDGADAVDEPDEPHGWGDELDEAKKRAMYLMIERHLTTLQYVAIFGEVPH